MDSRWAAVFALAMVGCVYLLIRFFQSASTKHDRDFQRVILILSERDGLDAEQIVALSNGHFTRETLDPVLRSLVGRRAVAYHVRRSLLAALNGSPNRPQYRLTHIGRKMAKLYQQRKAA